jgi:RNA polymerase primary sigma factor
VYYQYIKDINRYPLLSVEEEVALLKKVKEGNEKAVKKIVCSNLKFVINVAFMYKNQGFSLPELINEGNIGLIEAARRFDVSKNIRFISYAVWWIRQAITRAISEKARMVRISAEKELILRRISRFPIPMKQTIGGGMWIDARALSRKMGYSPEKMEKVLEMGQYHSSLDEPLDSDSGIFYLDVFKDTRNEPSDELAHRKSLSAYLSNALSRLNSQEQQVIKMYFGIDTHRAMSLEDIGELIGLSKERVRQIKEQGLESLRKFELPRELLLAA